jgi:hypothetical protein
LLQPPQVGLNVGDRAFHVAGDQHVLLSAAGRIARRPPRPPPRRTRS